MTGKGKNTTPAWSDPDDAPEWADEVWKRAEVAVGGKVLRPASGTLTRRGRPPVGDEPKRQVTLRLPQAVIEHFKAGGAGWQTRIGETLERHVIQSGGQPDRRSAVAEPMSTYESGGTGKRGRR